jgi:hypothetical protein
VEARGDRPGDLLVTRVEGRGAADPVEDVELAEPVVGGHGSDGRDVERQRLGPVEPGRRRLAPGIALALHRPKGPGQLGREAALLEDEVATQPDDLVDVLDEDRAGLDTCAAGDAIPDRVVRDRVIDDR